MKYTTGKIYKFDPTIEESDERFTFSHYNKYGSAFFHTVGKSYDLDQMFWLSATEVQENILIED